MTQQLRPETLASPIARHPTVVVRKRLPWLDGNQPIRTGLTSGGFAPNNPSDAKDVSPQEPPDSHTSGIHRAAVPSLEGDVALRAVGSTPSLRMRAKSGDFKTLSLSSKPRVGVIFPVSKDHAKQTLRLQEDGQATPLVASSEYSTTPSVEETGRHTPTGSHDLLMKRQTLTETPIATANVWFKSRSQLALDDPSPRTSTRGTSSIPAGANSRAAVPSVLPRRRPESCSFCDEDALPAEPPVAATARQRSVPVQPNESIPMAAFRPPARKPTIYAMPDHLLPSSSSSSWDPRRPHLSQLSDPPVTAPPQISQPPPIPLRRTTGTIAPQHSPLRRSNSLKRAVTGLKSLMEEALTVARDAAQSGRNDEVAHVLNSATLALRKASTVQGQMGEGNMDTPFRLSPPEPKRHHTDSESISPHSDGSSTHSDLGTVETAPTVFTMSTQPSRQPVVKDHRHDRNWSPRSQKASFESVHDQRRSVSVDRRSITRTPPRLYQPPSVDSIVRDFAYGKQKPARAGAARGLSRSHGAAEDYYGDAGQSVVTQPGVRPSVSKPLVLEKPLPPAPPAAQDALEPPHGRRQHHPVKRMDHVPTNAVPPRVSSSFYDRNHHDFEPPHRHRERKHRSYHHHLSNHLQSTAYRMPKVQASRERAEVKRSQSQVTDNRYDTSYGPHDPISKTRYSGPPTLLKRDISLRHPRRNHLSLREGQGFSLGRYHRRQPIARE